MWKLIAACLALGGVSLLLPSEPSYDPLAWLIWGRELAHLHLDTGGGPSWKPLPVAFTTLTAPLGEVDQGLPPALWMAVARAGALLALALAFRLARRLGGGGAAAVLGGLVASAALFLTPDWFQFAAHGSEAPLAVALMLWAVERQLDGRSAHALCLATLACLLRPELVPFLGLYGLWVWRAEPRLRPLLAAVLVVLPLAWVGPEWIGSGMPLDGGAQARSQPAWSLSLAEHPWLRALERVHNHAGLPLELLAALAVAVAAVRRRPAVLVLAGAAVAEAALFVAMTQAGFSGNPRYVLPAVAVLSVLAGVGAAQLAWLGEAALNGGDKGTGLVRRFAHGLDEFWSISTDFSSSPRERTATGSASARLAGVVAAVALIALAGQSFAHARVERLRAEAHEVGIRMQLHHDLAQAVRAAGGAEGPGARLVHHQPGPPDPPGLGAGGAHGADREPHRLPRDLPLFARAAGRSRVHDRARASPPNTGPRGQLQGVPTGRNHVPDRPPRMADVPGSVYRTFAGNSHSRESREDPHRPGSNEVATMRSRVSNTSASLRRLSTPAAWSSEHDDHRSRLSGSRQRKHDPADPRGWRRSGRRDRQAVLEPRAQVPPHPQGRAGDRSGRAGPHARVALRRGGRRDDGARRTLYYAPRRDPAR
jgi:hypothetical protein